MDLGIKDKVALVVGGSRGCGLAISRELAANGARVVLTGRERDHVDAAVAQIGADGGAVEGVVAAMDSEEGVRAMVEAARRAFGTPDIFVANPQRITHARSLADLKTQDLRAAFDVFVTSLYWLAAEIMPHIQERGWGRMVVLGSFNMKMLHLDDLMYAQNMRVAAAAFTKTLAHEYGRYGFTANCIATGTFETELMRSYATEQGAYALQHLINQSAMKRVGRPEEMAALVAFLCSDRAGFITGETIRIDGNYSHNLF